MSTNPSVSRAILDTNLAHKTADFDEPAMAILRHSWSEVKAGQEEALRLLSEAAALFRQYEFLHREKIKPGLSIEEVDAIEAKVDRNREAAARIEAFIARAG